MSDCSIGEKGTQFPDSLHMQSSHTYIFDFTLPSHSQRLSEADVAAHAASGAFDFVIGTDLLAWVGYSIIDEDPITALPDVCAKVWVWVGEGVALRGCSL